MIDNPLQLDAPNAVVAGGGALGVALANRLAEQSAGGQVTVLARRTPQGLADGVQVITVEASDPQSITAAAEDCSSRGPLHLLVNTVGLLHDSEVQPEKRLRDLTPENFHQSMTVNALFPALLAEGFSRALRHGEPAIFGSLSARVGSIGDNGLGGWYSYRASKAAQNMLLRTLSREWRISHPNVTVVALHPGTVASSLSRPFVSDSYRKRVLSPSESASYLLDVMRELSPADSGSFFDWRGESIPW